MPRAALLAASAMLSTMLKHRPDLIPKLQAHGTITAILDRNQTACDLPYYAEFEGMSVCQRYAGGAGGTDGTPVTACSEKNVLKEQDDPYERGTLSVSENICVHELAHTIMDISLTEDDLNRIHTRYEAAKASGRWNGEYAMTNDKEFFAVMSQCYFWAAPGVKTDSHPTGINGPDALKRYDPATFALIDSIYQGSADLR